MILVWVATKIYPSVIIWLCSSTLKWTSSIGYKERYRIRRYCIIYIIIYMEDVQSSQNLSNCEGSVDELVEAYNQGISNHHALCCSHISRLKLETPFYSDKLISVKKFRRKAEKICRWSSTDVHFDINTYICKNKDSTVWGEECGKDKRSL